MRARGKMPPVIVKRLENKLHRGTIGKGSAKLSLMISIYATCLFEHTTKYRTKNSKGRQGIRQEF